MSQLEKAIPKATAKRLSLYYRIFKRLHAEEVEKASSKEIAEAIGIDSATVRRDFSYFGELGRRGFGYDVKKLMEFFADLLNDNAVTGVILVGVGNMGRALLHYRFQERNKMQITQAFDTDDSPLVGTQSPDGIPIHAISSIKDVLVKTDIETAILTVPSVKAQEVADILVDAGIKGILSFSPINLTVPKDVVVQYVDLTSELQTLLYFMNQNMATSLIMVHNHPSGATEPSTHDISFTKKLKRSCDDMGIIFLDHLIVGKGTYYSFREESQLLA